MHFSFSSLTKYVILFYFIQSIRAFLFNLFKINHMLCVNDIDHKFFELKERDNVNFNTFFLKLILLYICPLYALLK